MENNPQNAQDVVPTLDNVLGGTDIITNENTPQPDNQGQGQQTQDPPAAPASTQDPELPVDPPVAPAPTDNQSEDDVVKLLSSNDNLLSADDKRFKETVHAQFGSTSIDFKGNLLDSSGEIVLTAEDLDAYINEGEIPTDKDGNQINAKGEIVKSAQDVNASYNAVNATRAFIEEELGLEFIDESGKVKVYENTTEGNRAFVKDAVISAQTNAVTNFLDSQPELKDIFYHLANGGSVEDYKASGFDVSTIDIDSMAKDQKIAYIRQSYERQGVKNAASIIKLLEGSTDEVITQYASEALLSIKELEDAERAANEVRYKQQQIENQKEVDDYWTRIKGVIDKGSLKDLEIPSTERTDFFKYIAEPINSKGETREMLDASKEEADFQLMVSYLRYKGGDVSKFIQAKAKTGKLDKLRQRVGINSPIPVIENNKERQSNTTGHVVPSIENLLG